MKKHTAQSGLPIINDRAVGIDIGSRFHVVEISLRLVDDPVRTFQAFTIDIEKMASERPLWSRPVCIGFRSTKSSRRTDFMLYWQTLGMLEQYQAERLMLMMHNGFNDFILADCCVRAFSLTEQLHRVVSDITGMTSMRIIRAIVAGERDVSVLPSLRDIRCKSSEQTIYDALIGNYQLEHLFALSQASAMYDAYQEQLLNCGQEVSRSLPCLALQQPKQTTL